MLMLKGIAHLCGVALFLYAMYLYSFKEDLPRATFFMVWAIFACVT